MEAAFYRGACYFGTYLDDYSGYSIVKLIKPKSEVTDVTEAVDAELEKHEGEETSQVQWK